jgi:hypothetical protein
MRRVRLGYFPSMADSRASDNDERQHLALIQRLWNELQASRKDPLKYTALADRIRREVDAFRQIPHTHN